MRNLAKYLCAAAIAAPAAAMTGDAVSITPGRWEEKTIVTAVSVAGVPLPLESFPGRLKTKFACVTPEEARDPKRYFGSPDDEGECQQPQGVVSGGKVDLDATCKMKDGTAMKLAVQGTYEQATYRMDVQGDADMKGQPFRLSMVLEGRFVGVCQGDEDDGKAGPSKS